MEEYTRAKILQAEFDEEVEYALLSILENRDDLEEYFLLKDCEEK